MDPLEGQNPKPVDEIARQTLKSLRHRWGVKLDRSSGEVIHVNGMHSEKWVRIGADRGDATVYQLERKP